MSCCLLGNAVIFLFWRAHSQRLYCYEFRAELYPNRPGKVLIS
jgi:hypothetical protein